MLIIRIDDFNRRTGLKSLTRFIVKVEIILHKIVPFKQALRHILRLRHFRTARDQLNIFLGDVARIGLSGQDRVEWLFFGDLPSTTGNIDKQQCIWQLGNI